MRLLTPWMGLVLGAGSVMAQASTDGLDAYRQGHYLQAAEQFNGDATDPVVDYYQGRMRLYGYGELKNNTMAMRYFKRAAERGFLPAVRFMARVSLNQDHDPAMALSWFKKAAEANDVKAQMYCAAAYRFGFGVSKNQDSSLRYIIEAAKNGNLLAQYSLAQSFLASKSSTNQRMGLVWLTKAVEKNDLASMLLLGQLSMTGKGAPLDLEKAKVLINADALNGYVPALVVRGDLALLLGDYSAAKEWYIKAGDDLALASFYLNDKNPMHDAAMGFQWTLKAAQRGLPKAAQQLSALYHQGIGVPVNEALAKQWLEQANKEALNTTQTVEAEMARWLSRDQADKLASIGYGTHGILTAWHNELALEENNYNQAPQFEKMSRAALYKPNFVMTNPNDIPLIEYYDAFVQSLQKNTSHQLVFPRFALTQKEVTARLIEKATLGDSTAQFQLGQLYQQGVSVPKNMEEAVKYYAKAAAQQDLRAEYNLGVLYLEGESGKPDYRQAMGWLNDAAFKGSAEAQYLLGQIGEQGYRDANQTEVLAPDHEQAVSMYYLSAANHYGEAQYRLAELLVRDKNQGTTVAEKQKRDQLMSSLYEGAVSSGVNAARLPYAFFQAMSTDPKQQSLALDVARKEAEVNNPEAALLLGLLYDRGIGVEASSSEAMEWYEKAGKNPVTAFIIGTYLAKNTEDKKNQERSFALLEEAMQSGFSYAPLNLAILNQQQGHDFLPGLLQAHTLGNKTASLLLADYYLAQGNDAERMRQAREIYQQLADKGDANGQLKLGYLLEHGLGGERDIPLAATWYQQSAEAGNALAQYRLGELNQLGWLATQPDYAAANKWYTLARANYAPAAVALGFIADTVDDNYHVAQEQYELAANKGDPIALFNLGLLYENGKGIPVQSEKAAILYRSAVEKGHVQAMVRLAGLYLNGALGSRDEGQALTLYQKAAEKGDRDAIYQLGLLSETGVALPLDYAKAVTFYKAAAAKGNAKAMLALARLYQSGQGVPQNNEEAATLYKALSKKGNAYAAYQLAVLTYKGSIVSKDKQEVTQWLKQAVDNGSTQAQRLLQWIGAQSDDRISFIEPIAFYPSVTAETPAYMYLGALSELNQGNEIDSRVLMTQLLTDYPNYAPALNAFNRLRDEGVWDQARL